MPLNERTPIALLLILPRNVYESVEVEGESICNLIGSSCKRAVEVYDSEWDPGVHACCGGESFCARSGQIGIADRGTVEECDFGGEDSSCSSIPVELTVEQGEL